MVYGAMVRKVCSTSHGQPCWRSRSHAMTARRRAIGSRGSDSAVGCSDAIRPNLNYDYRIIYMGTRIGKWATFSISGVHSGNPALLARRRLAVDVNQRVGSVLD